MRAIVAGTSFARARHPAWSYNLLAHPEAAISVRGRRLQVTATLIDDAARDESWRRIEVQWPGYRKHERESGRIVRLFLLEPVSERAGDRVGDTSGGLRNRTQTGHRSPRGVAGVATQR